MQAGALSEGSGGTWGPSNKPGLGVPLWAQCQPESPQCLSRKQRQEERIAPPHAKDTLRRAESLRLLFSSAYGKGSIPTSCKWTGDVCALRGLCFACRVTHCLRPSPSCTGTSVPRSAQTQDPRTPPPGALGSHLTFKVEFTGTQASPGLGRWSGHMVSKHSVPVST